MFFYYYEPTMAELNLRLGMRPGYPDRVMKVTNRELAGFFNGTIGNHGDRLIFDLCNCAFP